MDEKSRAYYVPPRKRSLFERLFPARWCTLPEAPAHYKDCIHFRMDTDLDWRDRLRVLLTGKVVVEARIVTENEVGATVSKGVLYAALKIELPK